MIYWPRGIGLTLLPDGERAPHGWPDSSRLV